jgi:intracellular multiplication protein IcmK
MSCTKRSLLLTAVMLSGICAAPVMAAQYGGTPGLPNIDGSDTSQNPRSTPHHSKASGILIPSPPPASTLSPDATNLAIQAQEAASRASTPVKPTGPLTPEQARAALENQQKQAEAEHKIEHNLKSFDKALTGLLPLSAEQIRAFMKKLEETQHTAQAPSGGPPKGEVKVTTLSLEPGVETPQINLAAGYVTTITMVDATGEPWPISDVGVGGNFEVSPTTAGTHVVRVMPLTRVGVGNISILLKDLSTPVIFRLSAGGPTVDMRYDARIPKLGPGAKVPLISHPRLEAGDEAIMMLLDNAPPSGAKRIKVSGVDERTMAWSLNNHVYVRTPLTLLSPAWDASVSSADGMAVYQIGDAPVLLMSDSGAMVRARLQRDDDHDK